MESAELLQVGCEKSGRQHPVHEEDENPSINDAQAPRLRSGCLLRAVCLAAEVALLGLLVLELAGTASQRWSLLALRPVLGGGLLLGMSAREDLGELVGTCDDGGGV